MNLFDWLNEITYHKRPWTTFTDEDKAEFNTYMINRFISMNSNYIDIVNLIQRYPDCPKRKVYQLYCELLPKQKAFFRYIKASTKNDLETIKAIAEYYQCSTREAKDYSNIIEADNIKKELNLGQPGTNKKMITFILGAVVAIATAVLGWLVGNVIWALRRVKSLENENQVQWREIEERYNSIERKLDEAIDIISRRIDDNYSYTDSRFDKFANSIERDYVSKVDKKSNTISYNS